MRVAIAAVLGVALLGCGSHGPGTGGGTTGPGTLAAKASEFQAQATVRHLQGGQVIPFVYVNSAGHLDHYVLGDMTDAAIWTGCYLAAQSFRYAATGEMAAYQGCRETLTAMQMLREVTGVPGLLARGFVPAYFGASGPEYHYSSDGRWIWAGDVSSDQLDGIIFGYYVFYRLAATPADKQAVAQEVSLLIGHVVENGMCIVDIDGQPTKWGHYEPWYVRDYEHMNALLILSHLKVAHWITGEQGFRDTYVEAIENYDYAALAETSVVKWPLEDINHSDHNLQWLAYYPLLSLENDPALYASYRRSLADAWGFVGQEGQTLFNFVEEALVPGTGNLAEGIETLREFSTDLRLFEVVNSTRTDLEAYKPFLINPKTGRPQIDPTRFPPLPVNERPLWEYEWAQNPYRLDGNFGAQGEKEQSGVDYLLAYWMGRYYGFLSPGD